MAPTTVQNQRSETIPSSGDLRRELLFDGTELLIRPVTHADLKREAAFLARLPPECRSYRFLGLIRQNGAAAAALTDVDPTREVSLLGLVRRGDEEIEVGAARFCADESGTRCDSSLAVDPAWQDLGVGTALVRHLIAAARRRGIRRMYAVDPTRASGRHWLADYMGFRPRIDPEDPQVITYELDLEQHS